MNTGDAKPTDCDARAVVFAANQYYQGRQELGSTSNWERLWQHSLQRSQHWDVITFHPDIYGHHSHARSDQVLADLIQILQPKYLIMIYHIGLNWRREFISVPVLREIRSSGVRVIAIWGDIQFNEQRRLMRRLASGVDLNVVTASTAAARRLSRNLNILYSWVPINDPLVVDHCDCGAMVSFAGSVRPERRKYIEALRNAGIDVHAAGGEGTGSLSRMDYLQTLAHPISLSFQDAGGFEPVMNARPYEIARQGVLLMEQWGPETARVFKPYSEYVPWKNVDDLISMTRYFIEHEDEREAIAARAQARVSTFTDESLWQQVWKQSQSSQPGFGSTMRLHNSNAPNSKSSFSAFSERLLESYWSELPLSLIDGLLHASAKTWRRTKATIRNPRQVKGKLAYRRQLKG